MSQRNEECVVVDEARKKNEDSKLLLLKSSVANKHFVVLGYERVLKSIKEYRGIIQQGCFVV